MKDAEPAELAELRRWFETEIVYAAHGKLVGPDRDRDMRLRYALRDAMGQEAPELGQLGPPLWWTVREVGELADTPALVARGPTSWLVASGGTRWRLVRSAHGRWTASVRRVGDVDRYSGDLFISGQRLWPRLPGFD